MKVEGGRRRERKYGKGKEKGKVEGEGGRGRRGKRLYGKGKEKGKE